MIRKLKSGEYRLYSRKTDPRTGNTAATWGRSRPAAAERHELARCSFSSTSID